MKLIVQDIVKQFKEVSVLRGASETFEAGLIHGLIGRNGAGKTTLFNIIYHELKADSGQILIEQDGVIEPLARKDVGMLFSEPLLPDFVTGYEFIKFFCEAQQKEVAFDLMFDQFELSQQDRHRLMKDYSHGMKNKIMLMMLFIQQPKVILLDEPLTSLDIVVAAQMKRWLRQLKSDHILLLSTHVLDLARDLCDRIVFLHHGQLSELDPAKLHQPDFEQSIIEALSDV